MTTSTFDIDLYPDNRDDLAKALIGEITYDPTKLEYVSTVEGKELAASQLPVFFKALTSPKQISVSAAVLGNGSTFDGSGLIATISFRLLGSGKTTVRLTRADIRDKGNRSLVAENIQLPEAETVASVDVPATYEIEQNQPNPFNPETVIKYGLPSATQVSIRIYNVVGQLVKTLVDDYQPAGQHQVVWNGTNENGERMASGIYLYRFATPDYQKTIRMTLLK
ncbi:MAG: cohesin domain-containing protein [candidate division Zixibacteria bacterium]|nr:cohesin domain-containing protein [candidate division Zixibacteria bacterium]